MGIYSNNSYNAVDIYSPAETEYNNVDIINFHEAAIVAVAESERVYNNAMKEIGIGELMYFEENGRDMIYESVDIKSVFEKIKKFFEKLIEKIKALFHAFITKMRSFYMDSREFANKYSTEFINKWNNIKSDFTFKGYKFTTNINLDASDFDSSSDIQGICFNKDSTNKPNAEKAIGKISSISTVTDEEYNALNTMIETLKDNKEELEEEIRGKIINKLDSSSTSSLNAEEFNRELFEVYRNGESNKIDLEASEFSSAAIISSLKDNNTTIKKIEKESRDITKTFKSIIKDLENKRKALEKPISDEKSNAKYSNYRTKLLDAVVTLNGFVSFTSQCITTLHGAHIQAVKDEAMQYKAIVARVIAGGKKMQRESYNFTDDSYDDNYGTSYLDRIVIK